MQISAGLVLKWIVPLSGPAATMELGAVISIPIRAASDSDNVLGVLHVTGSSFSQQVTWLILR